MRFIIISLIAIIFQHNMCALSKIEILRYKCHQCSAVIIHDAKIGLVKTQKEKKESRKKLSALLRKINKEIQKKEKEKFKDNYSASRSERLTTHSCKILLSSTGRCKAKGIVKPRRVKPAL